MKKTLTQFIVYILLLWGSFFSNSLFADSGTLYGAHHLQNGWNFPATYVNIADAGDAACAADMENGNNYGTTSYDRVENSMYYCHITRFSDGLSFNEPVAFVTTQIIYCGTDTFNPNTGQCDAPPPNNMFLSTGDFVK